MTVTSVLLIASAVTLVGIVLALVGWRGRRVGDHPYCRRCGFDLFGRARGSIVCSECGAELHRAGAVVVGVRTPRWRVAWAGVALLVPGMVVTGLIGQRMRSGVDWQKQKPTWWLAREARSSDVAARESALSTLLARVSTGALTKSQVEKLVAQGLQVQKDLRLPWSLAWGDIIEQARLAGQVSDEQWKTYAQQAVAHAVTLRVNQRLRRFEGVSFWVDYAPGRVGRQSSLMLLTDLKSVTIGGVEMRPKFTIDGGFRPLSGGQGTVFTANRVAGFNDRAYGSSFGTCTVQVSIVDEASVPPILQVGASPPALVRPGPAAQGGLPLARQRRAWYQQEAGALQAFRDGAAPALVTLEMQLAFWFEVVPPDRTTAQAVTDPELRQRVADAISVSRVRVLQSGSLLVEIECEPLPIDLSFDVFVRGAGGAGGGGAGGGGAEWAAGTLKRLTGDTRPAPPWTAGAGGADVLSALKNQERVEVILWPNAKAAAVARSPNIGRFWGEQIVIRDVPVEK